MTVAGAAFGPAIAATTLGILGSRGLVYRIGRNAAFDHAGNVFVALLAGAIDWWFSQSAVFYLVPIFSVMAASGNGARRRHHSRGGSGLVLSSE
jgi:hypothetical protein